MVTNINFSLTISIHCQEKWLWELIKWSPKRTCFDLLFNSLNVSLSKCMSISVENLYVDIGAKRVEGYVGYTVRSRNLHQHKQCIAIYMCNMHRAQKSYLWPWLLIVVKFYRGYRTFPLTQANRHAIILQTWLNIIQCSAKPLKVMTVDE